MIANPGETRRTAFTLGPYINNKPLTGDGIPSLQGSCNDEAVAEAGESSVHIDDAEMSDCQAPIMQAPIPSWVS